MKLLHLKMVGVVIRFQPVLSLYSYQLCYAAAWFSAVKLTYYAQYYVQEYEWFLVYIIEGGMKTMNKSLTTCRKQLYRDLFIRVYLYVISKVPILLHNDCSIGVYRLYTAVFHRCMSIVTYFL